MEGRTVVEVMLTQTAHRFSVQDFYRMAETGVLRPDARVELLDGQIIDLSPIGPLHGSVVKRLIPFSIIRRSALDVECSGPFAP